MCCWLVPSLYQETWPRWGRDVQASFSAGILSCPITDPGGAFCSMGCVGDGAQLRGKRLRKSMGNRAVKYRDGDETLPSAPGQTDCGEHSEQCQHEVAPAMCLQPCWCRDLLEVAPQLLVPNMSCRAPGAVPLFWRWMGSCVLLVTARPSKERLSKVFILGQHNLVSRPCAVALAQGSVIPS